MAVKTRIVESVFTKKIDAKNMIIFSFLTMDLSVIKIVFHAIKISLILALILPMIITVTMILSPLSTLLLILVIQNS